MVGARVEIAHNDDDIAIADGFCTGEFSQTQNAGRPIRAAAHRRFRVSRTKRHRAITGGFEGDGGNVGGGDGDHVGHRCARLVAGIDHVESAIIGLFGVSELMVGEKFVDVGFGKTCDEVVGDFLQGQYADIAFANIANDFSGVGASVSTIHRHNRELGRECFTRCFTVSIGDGFGPLLRSV